MRRRGRRGRAWWVGLLALLAVAAVPPQVSHAQIAREEAWKPLLEHEGLSFRYLFYSEADNYNNGVVLLLHNRNDYRIRFGFRIIFRDVDGNEHEETVRGTLAPNEYRTGGDDGLFWVPWDDGRSIAELGLRGYRVVPDPDA